MRIGRQFIIVTKWVFRCSLTVRLIFMAKYSAKLKSLARKHSVRAGR